MLQIVKFLKVAKGKSKKNQKVIVHDFDLKECFE